MDHKHFEKLMKFIDIPATNQRDFISQYSDKTNINPVAVEKDWWVSAVMRALFSLPYADSMSFKGGTSLSKCWGLIERFSEDIDIAVDRDFLGFRGELSKTQVSDKLRRAACTFVREILQYDLRDKMIEQGVNADKFSVEVKITSVTTTDPETVYIHYTSLFDSSPYVVNTVKIEVSGRSMNEPLETVGLRSMLEDAYPSAPFAEPAFGVPTVKPERTFLEKVCLLHEEYSKASGDIRCERMSRHLFDLYKMGKAGIADIALADKHLFRSIVEHRRKFIGLKGFDYDTLDPKFICIVPPDAVYEMWKEDYERMIEFMSYGEQPAFGDVITYIRDLNDRLRNEQ